MEKDRKRTTWPALEIAEALKNSLTLRGKRRKEALRRLCRTIIEEAERAERDFEKEHPEE